MTLGDIIKKYRKETGLSQDAVAKRAGVSKAYISILERNRNPKTGEPPIASLKVINDLAAAMSTDFDSIFEQLDDNIKISINEQLPKPSGETKPSTPTFDDFTFAMQNETKDLTEMDKQILLSMAKQLNDARKARDGDTE
nr:MAG TPA: hypothetical protein [Caudoviricetes sp.]